ncbi:MAG TPA: DUF115 domain-containing protein [Phycisphaerales bacterium]|nr:DUF115 domain-containing protein [Phycisphaerales bacterium]
MPVLTQESALASNLAAIEKRDPELARRLRDTPPRDDVEFIETPQGALAALVDGRQLCSRHKPLDEAASIVNKVDIIEHAVMVVLGFGVGWHVKALAQRMQTSGVIVVFEPDLGLLRAVLERIDHSSWLRQSIVLFSDDAEDRALMSARLEEIGPLLAMGVEIIEHAPSRVRLGARSAQFTSLLAECMTSARTSLATTLLRSVDTTRNLLHNLDHYAAGAGITDLANVAKGYPAVLVAAGPSLQKNIQQLAAPGVRDRCVIIAVQTALKPLLAAGVRPHYVTALDYHEISRRFYEGISAADLEGVTLVCEPKVHPVVPDSFPNVSFIRCCASDFLDQMLGSMKRDMGVLPAGATVAHLSLYLARHLGCDPIVLIGQDLGFTDGLYYSSGTAIHDDVWASELNPFNTIEMMEWQRIARHKQHLRRMRAAPTADGRERTVYSDGQMMTYLQQFEIDFLDCKKVGVTVIDATEGGVAKQHVQTKTLAESLQQYATRQMPALPAPDQDMSKAASRIAQVRRRVGEVRRDLVALQATSRKTIALIERMLEDQHDQRPGGRMEQHFKKLDALRREVDDRQEAFQLLSYLNQLGAFKRIKADRKLKVISETITPVEKQRLELERDIVNVRWIADASQELIEQLEQADQLLRGEAVSPRKRRGELRYSIELETEPKTPAITSRIAAMVPVDPHRNALGIPRSLAVPFRSRPVIQATLERLGTSRTLDRIVLLVSRGFDVESHLDRSRIGLPVEIEWIDGSPFGDEQAAIAAARLWSDTCWRGGVAGLGIYDEVLCPRVMAMAMRDRGLTAAVLAAPDWPLIDVSSESGCDAVVRRHLEQPEKQRLVFTQAPPGLGSCLVALPLMEELAKERNRLAFVGGLLIYQPHAPQPDAIGLDPNVQIDHAMRRSLVRATFDSSRRRSALERVSPDAAPLDVVRELERAAAEHGEVLPQQFILELCTDRPSNGLFMQQFRGIVRPAIDVQFASRLIDSVVAQVDDLALTLDGAGDPLLHPKVDEIIRRAKQAGVRAVHVRTELTVDRAVLDRLLASGVDVVSVDLHADSAATYQVMLGSDRFINVMQNIEYLIEHRKRLTIGSSNASGAASIALPWIVPRLQRRAATYEDIETFYERWQTILGTPVIEPMAFGEADAAAVALRRADVPKRIVARELQRRMLVLCDGRVPVSETDLAGAKCAGSVKTSAWLDVWRTLCAERAASSADVGLLRP